MHAPQISIGNQDRARNNFSPDSYRNTEQNKLRDTIKSDLRLLKKQSFPQSKSEFLSIQIEVKKGDTVSAIAYAIDNLATEKYRSENPGKPVNHQAKDININGSTPIHYPNGQVVNLGAKNHPYIYPGQFVSLSEVGGQVVVKITNQAQNYMPNPNIPESPIQPVDTTPVAVPDIPEQAPTQNPEAAPAPQPVNPPQAETPVIPAPVVAPVVPTNPVTSPEAIDPTKVDFDNKEQFTAYAKEVGPEYNAQIIPIKNKVADEIDALSYSYWDDIPEANKDLFAAAITPYIIHEKNRKKGKSSIWSQTADFLRKPKNKQRANPINNNKKQPKVSSKRTPKLELGKYALVAAASLAGSVAITNAMAQALPADKSEKFLKESQTIFDQLNNIDPKLLEKLEPYYKAVERYEKENPDIPYPEVYFQTDQKRQHFNFEEAPLKTFTTTDPSHPLQKIFGKDGKPISITYTEATGPINGFGEDTRKFGIGRTFHDGKIIISKKTMNTLHVNYDVVVTNEGAHQRNAKTIIGKKPFEKSFASTIWKNEYLKRLPTENFPNIYYNELSSDCASTNVEKGNDIGRIIRNILIDINQGYYLLSHLLMNEILTSEGYGRQLTQLRQNSHSSQREQFVDTIVKNDDLRKKIEAIYLAVGQEIEAENQRLSA